MKKLLCCVLCLLMLWYVVPVGMLSVNAQEIELEEAAIGDAVFSWDCSSLVGAPWGAWAYGATATEEGNIILRPTDNSMDNGYAAYYMWTGNLKEVDGTENIYAVKYGKTYVLNFKAKGEAGKEVQYDFKDGAIGMDGAYIFETTGQWEDVWSAPMTVNVDPEYDLAPGDDSIINGYPVRIFLNPNGNPLAASEVTIDDIVIYEYVGAPVVHEHTYDNACDETCNECGETRIVTHSYKTTTTKATTSANGKKVTKCTVCGDVKSTKTIYKIASVSLSSTKYTYNGSKKTPTVTVKDSKGNKLTNGEDYKLTYSSSKRTAIGRYNVKVTFMGDYSGSKTLYFTIGPKNPTTVSAKLYGYDDVKVTWTKVSGASGYRVYYKPSTSNTWQYKTITGNYIKLANLSDGVKYDIKVEAYKTVNGNKCFNAGKKVTVTTLKKIANVKVVKSDSKAKVSWTNINGETGYQISRSTTKTGTNIVSTYKTTSGKYKTITATKGKTYYYKVRAYKVVDGNKIYGPWSTPIKFVRK